MSLQDPEEGLEVSLGHFVKISNVATLNISTFSDFILFINLAV